jgi:hypothetical protein
MDLFNIVGPLIFFWTVIGGIRAISFMDATGVLRQGNGITLKKVMPKWWKRYLFLTIHGPGLFMCYFVSSVLTFTFCAGKTRMDVWFKDN